MATVSSSTSKDARREGGGGSSAPITTSASGASSSSSNKPTFKRSSSSSSKIPAADAGASSAATTTTGAKSPSRSGSIHTTIAGLRTDSSTSVRSGSRSIPPTPNEERAPPHEEDEGGATNGEDDMINMETFNQILEMDEDDEEREFSKGLIIEYVQQAGETLEKMQKALDSKDLTELSSLGHFLKGSSSALGVNRVQKSCERMQHYGSLRDEEKNINLKQDKAIELITELLATLKEEFSDAKRWLDKYTGEDS